MRTLLGLLSLLAGLSVNVAQAHVFGLESDSGIHGPKYAELVSYFSTLPQKYPGFVQVNQYGTTAKGRPLLVIRIAFPTQYRTRLAHNPAILISGSTHGDEYLNIEDRLPEWFLKEGIHDPAIQPFFQAGGMLYIVPIFNPDGYDARQRGNSTGQDLNRDFTVRQANFTGFRQIETKAVRDLIATQLKAYQQHLVLTMDYHCCIGAALYPWSFDPSPSVPADVLARFQAAGKVIKAAFGSQFPVGRTPDILGYDAIGTSKDFYYESFGALSFTYEGEYAKEKNKFPLHTQMWKGLIQGVTNRR